MNLCKDDLSNTSWSKITKDDKDTGEVLWIASFNDVDRVHGIEFKNEQ